MKSAIAKWIYGLGMGIAVTVGVAGCASKAAPTDTSRPPGAPKDMVNHPGAAPARAPADRRAHPPTPQIIPE